VGLVAFKGARAELLLPPTRALTRARRALGGLPGGGGTPLASALVTAAEVVDGVQREGARAAVVLLTDGRANIALDGTPGRPRALQDAKAAAGSLRARRALIVVVDTSPRGDPNARTLAEALAARYIALPVVTARTLHARVREAVAEAEPAGGRV
jgi:magnesium chelatase subunit D